MTESAADRWAARVAASSFEASEMLDPGEDAAAPNCPECLSPLELAGSVTAPQWVCSTCGHTHS